MFAGSQSISGTPIFASFRIAVADADSDRGRCAPPSPKSKPADCKEATRHHRQTCWFREDVALID
jgi:hypothetical protein